MTAEPVGVVGASARAAVMSLMRAGFRAWAIDLFADRDLQRLAPVRRCPIDDFPQAIPALAGQFPPGPVLYTGGLENYPEVIAALATEREVWGCPADVLPTLRDPRQLAEHGFDMPRTLPAGTVTPAGGTWLLKSQRSSGGLGVRLARPGEIAPPGHDLQEFVDGWSLSAVFRGNVLLGVTEQLVGTAWLHARPFHYAGTIAPVELTHQTHRSVVQTGEAIADVTRSLALRPAFGEVRDAARGNKVIWGFDFILSAGRVVLLEINPRYPASLEVLEYAGRFEAFSGQHANVTGRLVGKGIYFAPRSFRFPHSGPWDADLDGPFDPWKLPQFADIPAPGEPMHAGSPVLTMFAAGDSIEAVRTELQSRAAELDSHFARIDA
jgi:predicted ATP-grasp superfamily ATP-dependent carboligase